jgi:hypothetical protein
MKAFAAYQELPDAEKREMLFNMGYLKIPVVKDYFKEKLCRPRRSLLTNQMLDLLRRAGQIKSVRIH